MRKLLIALVITLFAALPAHAFDPCFPDSEKYKPIAERYKKGLLFKISRCGYRSSYLLGTMHSDDPRVVDLLEQAFSKLAYMRSASFEIDVENKDNQQALSSMYYPPDSVETLQDTVGMELYGKLRNLIAKVNPDLQETTYYKMRPWAVAVMLQQPVSQNDGVALDFRLQDYARKREIPVYQLETAAEQMRVFDEVPPGQQIEFLRDAVEDYEQVSLDNKKMEELYLAEDLNGLQKLGDESFKRISDRQFAEELEAALVDRRNRKMVNRMIARLEEGEAFIAVGALHLTGENGMLKMLEDKGYYIDVLPSTQEIGM